MGVGVRRYIDILILIITFPYSTCISSFFGSSIPTSLFIFKMGFSFFNYIIDRGIGFPRSRKMGGIHGIGTLKQI